MKVRGRSSGAGKGVDFQEILQAPNWSRGEVRKRDIGSSHLHSSTPLRSVHIPSAVLQAGRGVLT